VGNEKQFTVIDLPELNWPASLKVPKNRFGLFIAADTLETPADSICAFAIAALHAGMVYFSAWGRGCERFHDVVDECLAEPGLNVVGTTANDVVMTTWHDKDSLDEALNFFATCTVPTDGFSEDSDLGLVVCVGHPEWAASARRFLRAEDFSI